ncbi:hypothetical protein K7Q65_002382, partial [Enterococcus faecalis]|nr:hypothetical protein [Enterococcus faecalis]
EEYSKSWYNKVLSYKPKFGNPAKGVVFIDCMSNSGVYQYKNSIYSGTSQRIEKMFISQNGVKYEDKNFKIVVNDNCLKRIDCQKCTWRRVANKRNNVEKLFFHLDVEQFLTNECLAILNEAKKNDWYILLFYDPFNILINWESLRPYLEYPKADIILTHFWGNDTIRAIGQVNDEETKTKYVRAYGVSYEELEAEFLVKTQHEKTDYLRNRLVSMINTVTPKKKIIGYGPIFNSKNSVMYDIVSISTSKASKVLLKNNLYKGYKEDVSQKNRQLDLFDISYNEQDYVESRNSGTSEKDYFYSGKHYAQVIYSTFKDQYITKADYDKFLNDHEYIPVDCKTEVKFYLEQLYNIVPDKKGQSILGYDFRNKETIKNE